MKVYLAAPWSEKAGLAKEAKLKLEAAGHEVVSSWIDREVGEPPYSDALMRSEALDDWREVRECEALVLINSQERGSETSGKAVETGLALAWKIPIVLVGNRSNVFHHLSGVKVRKTIEEAIKCLARLT